MFVGTSPERLDVQHSIMSSGSLSSTLVCLASFQDSENVSINFLSCIVWTGGCIMSALSSLSGYMFLLTLFLEVIERRSCFKTR